MNPQFIPQQFNSNFVPPKGPPLANSAQNVQNPAQRLPNSFLGNDSNEMLSGAVNPNVPGNTTLSQTMSIPPSQLPPQQSNFNQFQPQQVPQSARSPELQSQIPPQQNQYNINTSVSHPFSQNQLPLNPNLNRPIANPIPQNPSVQKPSDFGPNENRKHINQFYRPLQSNLPGGPPTNGPPAVGQMASNTLPPTGQPHQFGQTQHFNQSPNQAPLPGQSAQTNQLLSLSQSPIPNSTSVSSQPPMIINQPPLPGQLQSQPPTSQISQLQMPPTPGHLTNQYGANQISNQMQNLNLGQRSYPTGLLNSTINGENGPHMPPPLGQQTYSNAPHRKPGYPPVQPPMLSQPMPGLLSGQGTTPGQGPLPGMGPGIPGSMGQYPQSYQQQQQQQRRLDPDQMPSPIQVMQDDQKSRSGLFCTNQKGLVPPLVTTKFEVQDQGNASPRFIRSTMYNIPVTQDLIKQTSVPFALIISPLALQVDQEFPPSIVNFGDLGPVRCIRCKAYMCPYMQFIDGGRRFQCLFCKASTDVPAEYFQHLDHTGQRMDRFERPELVLGAYEFIATKDYCRNNEFPQPPAIIFVIDVSYNNIKSGLVHLLCSQMKDIIKNLPIDQGQEKSNMRVGFITYNKTVHFYNIKGSLAAPQMLVVGDVQDMFMPLLDGFLSSPEESETVIDALMQQIPSMFSDTRETETILLPAIIAGLEALKASGCAGKLLVFHSSLPTAEAPGKLKNRDDRKVLGTDRERTVLQPQTQAYNQLGQDCVSVGCSVDLFIFNNSYIDMATIGQVSRLTGGEIYKYTYFQADIDGDRFVTDLVRNISRPIAFDCMMRVRSSTGVRPVEFYGHFFMSNTTDMELASIDCDKAVAVEIKHDDKLAEEEGVYIQVALLYTSCSGQRRLRILNLSLKTCSQMADLYRSCELDTLINYYAKQACYKLLETNPKAVKDAIVARSAQILANYRKNCASPSSAGQLILPECMKLLPLYVNCLLKSDAISGGSDMTVDDKSYQMYAVMTMDVPSSVSYFYPRLIPLHEVEVPEDNGIPVIPPPIRCSVEKMTDQGLYLLENGIHMLLWIGLGISSELCQQVFGIPSPMQINVDKPELPELDNPFSVVVNSVIDQIRSQRHRCMRLTLVRQREKLEPVFKHFLVEDRGTDGSPSYVDFLCHMHKEIRNILS